MRKVQQEAHDAFTKMGMSEKGFENQTKVTTGAIEEQRSMIGELTTAAAGMFAAFQVFEWGKQFLDLGREMQKNRADFETLTGNIDMGKQAYEELNAVAKQYPILGKQAIMEAGKGLLEVGVAVDKVGGKIKLLGEVAGSDPGKLQELTAAYEKATAKGMVTNRMLLSQPALLQEVGRMHGLTGKALSTFMEEGVVTIKDFDKALVDMTSNGGRFAGHLEREMDTVSGMWASMTYEMKEDLEGVFAGDSPLIKSFINDLKEGYDEMKLMVAPLKDDFHTIGQVFEHAFSDLKESLSENKTDLQDWLEFFSSGFSGAVIDGIGLVYGLGNALGWASESLQELMDPKHYREHDDKAYKFLHAENFEDKDWVKKARQEVADHHEKYQAGHARREDANNADRIAGALGGDDGASPSIAESVNKHKQDLSRAGGNADNSGGGNSTGLSATGNGTGKTINQHINQLVGKIEIHAATLTESEAQIRNTVVKILLGITNDAQTAN